MLGKNKRGLLSKLTMGNASPMQMPEANHQPEATLIRADNGGYSMRARGKTGYASEKHTVHPSLTHAIKAMKSHFGGGTSMAEEAAEGEAGA